MGAPLTDDDFRVDALRGSICEICANFILQAIHRFKANPEINTNTEDTQLPTERKDPQCYVCRRSGPWSHVLLSRLGSNSTNSTYRSLEAQISMSVQESGPFDSGRSRAPSEQASFYILETTSQLYFQLCLYAQISTGIYLAGEANQ